MKTTEKLLLAGLVVVIVTNAVSYSNIKKMKYELSQLRSETSGIRTRMMNIEGNISNTMGNIARENQWIYDQGFDIISISEDLNNTTIALRWSFRNLDNASKVFISYGEKNPTTGGVSKWTELPAADSGVLSYRKELSLSSKSNYKFKIVAKSPSGTKSGELADVDLSSIMQGRIDIQLHPLARDPQGITYALSIQNQLKHMYAAPPEAFKNLDTSKFKIKSIKIDIYIGNQQVRDFYIYQEGKVISGYDVKSDYNNDEIEILDMKLNEKLQNDMNKPLRIEATVEDFYGNLYTSRTQDM